MPDIADLHEFVRLKKIERELDRELKATKEQLSKVEEPVLEYMTMEGMQSTNLDGMTLYMNRQLWASAKDVAALAAFGPTKDLVQPKVNGQTLSAWVRELEFGDDGMPLVPAEVVDAINVSEKFRVGAKLA